MKSQEQLGDFGDYLLHIAELVIKGQLGLHDDRKMLVPKEELITALSPISSRDIKELLDNQLLTPVEHDHFGTPLFHIANSVEFLTFLEELEQAGFPLMLQQTIAETYQALLWAFYSDIDYEISEFKKERGREPSEFELAYLRVLNEFAVAMCMKRIEEDILAGKADELKSAKERVAQLKRASLRKASFGLAETQIEEIVRNVWKSPLQYFRNREIKAFIDIKSIQWTKREWSLLWGGHFDFALCDENGILGLVIEYHGKGHYGRSADDSEKAKLRDATKQAICDKVGVPLVHLDPEYAFIQSHKQLFRQFLEIFRKKRNNYDSIIQLIREQVSMICSKSAEPSVIDPRLMNIRHRLDIYEMQRKGANAMALLWDLHRACFPMSPLPEILRKLNS